MNISFSIWKNSTSSAMLSEFQTLFEKEWIKQMSHLKSKSSLITSGVNYTLLSSGTLYGVIGSELFNYLFGYLTSIYSL